MTTEYRVRVDRDACDGVFACLVRDDRFVEAADGFASIVGAAEGGATDDAPDVEESVAVFDDARVEDARQAARACPVDAIEVTPLDRSADGGTR